MEEALRGNWVGLLRAAGRVGLTLLVAGLLGVGCASPWTRAVNRIPSVPLDRTPAAVRATITTVAAGRHVERVNCTGELEGPLYRAYITDKLGPQLLTVDSHGTIVDNAVVVRFEDMPEAVRKSAQTAVAGTLTVCRKSIHRPETTYVIDYLVGGNEPVYALIDQTGLVRTAIGYAEGDEDEDQGADKTK